MARYFIEDVKCGVTEGGFACGPVPGDVIAEVKVKTDTDETFYVSLAEVTGIPNFFKTERSTYDEQMQTNISDKLVEYLNANLMGNGFKLKLVGDNNLKGIVVWGFMYGGSLTVTGDGKLTLTGVNGEPAIKLECENSPSCLMIDSNVTIEIKGGSGNAR